MHRAWLVPVGGVIVAPLITWWPMLAHQYPRLGLPQYHAAQGIDFWSAQAFWLVALSVIAAIVWASDRWLACAVALAGATIFFRGVALDPTHSALFALGALMVCAMRWAPAAWHGRIKAVLVAMGGFQLAYMAQQWAGYDLLWGPVFGGQLLPKLQPLGTLGTVDAAAASLAITAPLMPWWALPVIFVAVWQTHAVSASVALAAGLAVRYRRSWALIPIAAGGLAVAYVSAFSKSLNPLAAHLAGRGAIWAFAGSDWLRTDPVVGYGLGGWAGRIPALQVQHQFAPTQELWREAHNEPFQWLCETGVIGLVILAGWLWTHRAMFAHPVWGGSVAAIGVNALAFFPLHVVQLALMAVIVVGLATSHGSGPRDSTVLTKAESASEWGAET